MFDGSLCRAIQRGPIGQIGFGGSFRCKAREGGMGIFMNTGGMAGDVGTVERVVGEEIWDVVGMCSSAFRESAISW